MLTGRLMFTRGRRATKLIVRSILIAEVLIYRQGVAEVRILLANELGNGIFKYCQLKTCRNLNAWDLTGCGSEKTKYYTILF